MVINKICMSCFRKYFGPNARVHTVTWSAQCGACHALTPPRGLLVKADVTASVAAEHE